MARVADLSGNSPIGTGIDPRCALNNDSLLFNDVISVVPSDTVDLEPGCRALYVGGTGNITLITREGRTELIEAIPVGTQLNIATKRVMATGTTATLIDALY